VSSNKTPRHLLVGEGGISQPPADIGDPFEALDDLMQVVEALCPKWPEREDFDYTGQFKL
jgi:hypothetical protein